MSACTLDVASSAMAMMPGEPGTVMAIGLKTAR